MASNNEVDGREVPLKPDELTFKERQRQRIQDMERRVEEEIKRKKKDWEKEVERMAEEFLTLYPADKSWGSDELLNDPYVVRRRGSTDVLDNKRMRTMYLEYPDKGRRYKIRFDMKAYKRESVRVIREIDRFIVRATKEEDEDGKLVERDYVRKVAKPHDVDLSKMKSHMTSDGVLIIEAPLPPHSLNLAKLTGSPSHSSTYSTISSSRSRSPSNSPHTPVAPPKVGIPVFSGQNGERRMQLLVDIGKGAFKPKEITVQVIKENRILVKAKHEERTSDRFLKSKFCKEYELSEKIETYSLRAGLMEDGKLVIGALGKTEVKAKDKAGVAEIVEEINAQSIPCNVLDLSNFPPKNAPTT